MVLGSPFLQGPKSVFRSRQQEVHRKGPEGKWGKSTKKARLIKSGPAAWCAALGTELGVGAGYQRAIGGPGEKT